MKKILFTILPFIGFQVFAQSENWVKLGSDLNVSNPTYEALEFDNNGNAYFAYSNNAANASLNVQKFDGLTWSQVGPTDFTSGALIREKAIAFDTLGVPVVAFTDGTNNLTVVKYNGSQWDTVGTSGFAQTDGTNYRIGVIVNKVTNQPVVAYRNFSTGKLSVQTFSGTTWDYFNSGSDISDGNVSLIDISTGYANLIFVGYADASKSDTAVVLNTYYAATTWYTSSDQIIASNGPVANLEIDATDYYPSIIYINTVDNKLYYNRLSGAPTWQEYAEPIGTADFYQDIALKRATDFPAAGDLAAYIGFSDTDDIYDPTTKKVTDYNFNTTVANTDDVDNPGFTSATPYNIVFGVDQNDSIYVAFGSLTVQVYKLRSISSVTTNELSENRIDVYPNPAENTITVESTEMEIGDQITIVALDGKLVFSEKLVTTKQQLDLSHLMSGNYIIQIIGGSGIITKKITLN